MKTKISAGTVVGFDGQKHVLLENGEVVFEDDRILFVGMNFPGKVDRTIDGSTKLVLPGLINTHTHSLSSPLLYRGILEDEGAMLYKYLLPMRFGTPSRPPYASGEDGRILSRLTLLENLRSGATTVFEQTDNLEDVLQLSQDLGIRIYGCHSYFSGMAYEENGRVVYPPFKDSCPGFDENLALIKKYQDAAGGRIKVWLGPHAADTCSPDLLKETRKKANELKVGIGTHVSQSLAEIAEMKRRTGKTPVEFLADLDFWGEDVIAAHAIFTTGSDTTIFAGSGMTVAHTASSYVKNGVAAPLAKYRRRGVNVALGSDQNTMDLFIEMRLALFSSKLNEGDANATTCLDVFNGVTLNPAKAFGRPDLGRIAPGAKADLVLLEIGPAHFTPYCDPLKMLIYHGNRGDVDTVIVDGKVVMAARKVLTVDEEEVVAKAAEAAHRVWGKAEADIGLPHSILDRVERL